MKKAYVVMRVTDGDFAKDCIENVAVFLDPKKADAFCEKAFKEARKLAEKRDSIWDDLNSWEPLQSLKSKVDPELHYHDFHSVNYKVQELRLK